jgi:hypothetical protein
MPLTWLESVMKEMVRYTKIEEDEDVLQEKAGDCGCQAGLDTRQADKRPNLTGSKLIVPSTADRLLDNTTRENSLIHLFPTGGGSQRTHFQA